MPKESYILDTGPLVLLTIGLFDKEHISKVQYKQRRFQKEQYDLLYQFLQGHSLVVSPQILAEMCNIAEKSLSRDLFQKYMQKVKDFLENGLIEIYTHKNELLKIPILMKFGFADVSLLPLIDATTILIAGDFPLFNYCLSKNKNVKILDQIIGLPKL